MEPVGGGKVHLPLDRVQGEARRAHRPPEQDRGEAYRVAELALDKHPGGTIVVGHGIVLFVEKWETVVDSMGAYIRLKWVGKVVPDGVAPGARIAFWGRIRSGLGGRVHKVGLARLLRERKDVQEVIGLCIAREVRLEEYVPQVVLESIRREYADQSVARGRGRKAKRAEDG